ncbi:hypothetical protein [Arthrobacter jiangjiafuii]|uniref:hypothetical protein n=1 Tax=Arthrobacter jiangjiafuii TaxID=2817475 RepID=UPI003080878B
MIVGDTALEDAIDERVFTVGRADPVIVPSPAELPEAAATLNFCEKVTILAGAGVEGAREEVLALADALGAPIVHALRGKDPCHLKTERVRSLTESLWAETRGTGVTGSALSPGATSPEFTAVVGTEDATAGARMGTPDDVVGTRARA